MRQTPNRPDSIPAAAFFDADLGAWEFSNKNSRGERNGLCDFYRADGSHYLNTCFVDGVKDGPFSMFHPNGELARHGHYVNGELDGELNAYSTDIPNALPLRTCCVPAGAFHLKAEYRHGQLVREAFFDATGTLLASIHEANPARPGPVPDDADFDDATQRWVQRDEIDPIRHIDRYWSSDGTLSEELEYSGGHNHRRRRFDAIGQLAEECDLDMRGIAHGSYLIRYANASDCPYSDSDISEERGQYWHGQHVEPWQLLDRQGNALRIVQCGLPFEAIDFGASPAFARLEASADDAEEWLENRTPRNGRRTNDAEEWLENHWGWSLTESLVQSSRVREALCLAARVAARHGERERFEQFLAQVTFPLSPELRAQRGALLMNNATATLEGALEELVTGTEPAAAYRVMASLLEGMPEIAHDWVQASLLLEPDRPLTYFTRALLRLELGDDLGAVQDAERCAIASAEAAEFIRESIRIYFGEFTFWPNREPLEPAPETAPDVRFEQPLEAVRLQVQIYATRLRCLREAIQRHLDGRQPDWLPPDLATILPSGPVELRRLKATLVDESELGTESTEVEIDESISTIRQGVTSLMTQARANWAALTWLCWAAGLDRVALPERIEPPADFKSAVSQAVMRQFQVEDRLKTGGMLSLTQGLASFDWEGLPIEGMNPQFLAVAAAEYTEMRAMFLWLIWEKNLSPFQSDLRGD